MLASSVWSPEHLDELLLPIAMLESSGGKNTNHAATNKVSYWNAYGALGLKPIVGYEAYKRDPAFRAKFPDIKDIYEFEAKLKGNYILYNYACNSHFKYLLAKTTSLKRAVYAWRYGINKQVDDQSIDEDQYVINYFYYKENASWTRRLVSLNSSW